MTYEHFLEFQQPGDPRLGQSAGRFLEEALSRGGIAVAIATRANARGILAQLARSGHDPISRMREERLLVFESSEMLSRFMGRHAVLPDLFDSTVGATLREALERAASAPVRVFGDMVGVLWQRQERQQAILLESLWSRLQRDTGAHIFCAYPIDVLDGEFSAESIAPLLEAHTHFASSTASPDIGRALDRAIADVLGANAVSGGFPDGEKAQPPSCALPKLERLILHLRSTLPAGSDAVWEKARAYYGESSRRTHLRRQHSGR